MSIDRPRAGVCCYSRLLHLPLLSVRRAIDCPGTRQSVQVEVKGEPLMLQFGGATAARVKIAVLRIWPFEWKW